MTPDPDQHKTTPPDTGVASSAASPVTRDADGAYTVDAGFIAPRLGLEPARFMALLREGRIFQVAERGEGEDTGSTRLTFIWAARRCRLVIDADCRITSETKF